MKLPSPRGPLSGTVVTALNGEPGRPIPFAAAGPYGEDLTIALHTSYELHYGGFDGVDPAWERDPELTADVVFGIQATELLESRLAAHLLSSWRDGESSLRTRLRWLVSRNG